RAAVEGRGDVTARCGDVDAAAVVGEARAAALAGGRGHGDHVRAVGGNGSGDIRVLVAGRHHHRGTATHGAVDGVLVRRRAAATTTQAQVDHVGRIGVGRHAADGAARCPGDGIGDV